MVFVWEAKIFIGVKWFNYFGGLCLALVQYHKCSEPAVVGVLANNRFGFTRWRGR